LIVDCHSHLDDKACNAFVKSLQAMERKATGSGILIISNSVDIDSSKANISLAKSFPKSVIPFVGIHPQVVISEHKIDLDLETLKSKLKGIAQNAKGIGEIGLDAKYEKLDTQIELFEMQLEIAKDYEDLPITIHSRGMISRILDILSTFNLSNKLLFHWFSGTEQELSKIGDLGIYISFGPALLFSKRLSNLLARADQDFVLAETDSPLRLGSFPDHELVSPFLTTSVVFNMGKIKQATFQKITEIVYHNSIAYLQG
jgi:TatD DNase family protein